LSGPEPPSDADFQARLQRLKAATEHDRSQHGQGQHDQGGAGPDARAASTATGFAFRIGVELVAGLVVGGGIGWLLDRWWHTGPFMLLLFFFLGAAAGILNVFRAAKEMQQNGGRP
jgi:ATP synthase protein I